MSDCSGVILLDKPRGWTSRRAVDAVIRALRPHCGRRIRAGHGGTLDPLATGMLPILVGEATRFAGLGLNADKCYEVVVDLSFQTDTLDGEGEVVARFDPPAGIDRDRVEAVLSRFAGEQRQIPPRHSAIKMGGRRAHELARGGEALTMEARAIRIDGIELCAWEPPLLTLRITCSKGTYVRALARDVGAAMGLGGCVVALRRLSSGGWPAEAMVDAESFLAAPLDHIRPLAEWLGHLPRLELESSEAARFVQGQRLRLDRGEAGACSVFADELLLGTGELVARDGALVLQPRRVLPSARERIG